MKSINIFTINESYFSKVFSETKKDYEVFGYSTSEMSDLLYEGSIIGFDTEYVTNEDGSRQIVSYQAWTEFKGMQFFTIIIPTKNNKLKFKDFLESILQTIKTRVSIAPRLDVTFTAHWGLVDWSAFKDARKEIFKKNTTFEYKRSVFTAKPLVRKHYLGGNTKKEVSIEIRDSYLLGPNKASLAKLGKALNFNKVELPTGVIERMDEFLKEDPIEFIRYAAQDCIISAKWLTYNFTNIIPTTTGQYASTWAEDFIRYENGWDSYYDFLKEYKGKTTVVIQKRGRTTEEEITIPTFATAETLAMMSVKGGMNASFSSGIFYGDFIDVDLSGAYPTAASLIKKIDFDRMPSFVTGNLTTSMIDPLKYGFGYVRFKYPKDTRFPALPIKDSKGRGLIYPLEGETFATNPEIYTALKQGATVTALNYTILEEKDEHIFKNLFKQATEERSKYKKGTATELLIKERNNSIVGKVGQGVNDYLTNKKNGMPFCNITNPYYYSMTTAIVRSYLIDLIDKIEKRNYKVHSITTDGFITDAPAELIKELEDSTPIGKALKETRRFLSGEEDLFTIKHRMDTLINIKTRANIGLNKNKSGEGVLACGNYKISREVREMMKEDAREEIAALYLERSKEKPVEYNYQAFTTFKQYIKNNDLDIASKQEQKKASWEFDFKRKPYDIKEESVTINGVKYKAPTFFTKPWDSIESFDRYRNFNDDFRPCYNDLSIYEDLPFLLTAYEAGLRFKSIKKAKAQQIARYIAAGYIKTEKDRKTITKQIAEFYGIRFTTADFNNAVRPNSLILPYRAMKKDFEKIEIPVQFIQDEITRL